MIKIGTLVISCLFSINVYSFNETSPKATIGAIHSHADYGGGDVVFSLSSKAQNCDGYWVSKSQLGSDFVLSQLLAAYHSKLPVEVIGITEQKWAGSSNTYCKLHRLSYPLTGA